MTHLNKLVIDPNAWMHRKPDDTQPEAWIPFFPQSKFCPEKLKEGIEAVGFGEVDKLDIRDSTKWPWNTSYKLPGYPHYRIYIYFKNLDETRKKFFEGGGVIEWWYSNTLPFSIRKVDSLNRNQQRNR